MADPFTLTIPTKRYVPQATYVPMSPESISSLSPTVPMEMAAKQTSPLISAVVPAVMAAAATASVVLSAHTLWTRYKMKKSNSCPEFRSIKDDTRDDDRHFSPPPAMAGRVARGPIVRGVGASPDRRDDPIPIAGDGTPKDSAALRSSRSQNKSLRERDQYEKMKEIGRGAFGVVYIGRHIRTGELVAIKEMEVQGADELRTEFQILQHLHHDHIVTVKGFEVGKKHARLYLEWVAGGSLAEIIRNRHIEDEQLLACYLRQILEGLAYLHENDILHRDIKPRNILVDHKGLLKLTDFGLSRHLESMQDKTKCAGTPIYMAPEVMHGRFSIGSDIWALGATMSEMATGKLPWSHIDPAIFNSQMALMMHIAKFQGDAGHHPFIPPTLSPEGISFMQKCFAPDPIDRGTCRELLQHPFIKLNSSAPATLSPGEKIDEPEDFSSSEDSFDVNHRVSEDDTPMAPNTVTVPEPPLLTDSQRGAGQSPTA